MLTVAFVSHKSAPTQNYTKKGNFKYLNRFSCYAYIKIARKNTLFLNVLMKQANPNNSRRTAC